MVIQKSPCKRHPARFSSRKCYYCKDFICSSCQVIFQHHIFCGTWCFIKYAIKHNTLKLRFSKKYAYLLAGIVVFQLILFFILRLEMHSMMKRMLVPGEKSTISQEIDSTSTYFSCDTSFVPSPHFLSISGNAPSNAIIGLWHNGKFVSSVISSFGQYKFPPQILALGKNSINIWALYDNGKKALVDSFSVTYFSHRLYFLARSISKLSTDKKVVALTFDAGSGTSGADSIIRILHQLNVKSTFFLTGRFIREFPDLVQRLISDGHEFGNHTYSHPHLTSWEQDRNHTSLEYVDRKFIYAQLNKTDSIFYHHFKEHLRPFWRAPYGEYNKEILIWAAELGYKHIRWTDQCDTWDWVDDPESPFYRTPDEIYAHLNTLLINEKLNGAIILMHFGSNRKNDFPYEMLNKLIGSIREKDYKILTISQLLSYEHPV